MFVSLADIMDACEIAWNRFATDHGPIRSLRGRLGSSFARFIGGTYYVAEIETTLASRNLRRSVLYYLSALGRGANAAQQILLGPQRLKAPGFGRPVPVAQVIQVQSPNSAEFRELRPLRPAGSGPQYSQ